LFREFYGKGTHGGSAALLLTTGCSLAPAEARHEARKLTLLLFAPFGRGGAFPVGNGLRNPEAACPSVRRKTAAPIRSNAGTCTGRLS